MEVDSSNIDKIGFDSDAKILYVEFQPKEADGKKVEVGDIYSYWPFTKAKFNSFKKADSKGGWFSKYIRNSDKYLVKKVRG